MKQLALTAPKARRIGLMSVSVTGLRPAATAVSAGIGSFIEVESEVVLEATYLREKFAAVRRFARPNFVHSICHSVPHVGDYEVSRLL